ncbi:hypothetical protein AVEN_31703-1 [Araneus ventricosus]|uniref:Uncharacterized protein n=1 Tax=Araneus ventricosus TaxID=182803 RepID=A0A4Y2HFZ3_ARAVE|nr:hypothetical protein AVEN_31703-1 [Araneus ventricosus]
MNRYNPSTVFEVSLLQYMSGDQSVDGSHATTSPKGTYTFAATSDVDVVVERRAEDRHFVFPISGKSKRRRADFVVHFRSHTGLKPCLRYLRRRKHYARESEHTSPDSYRLIKPLY